MIADDDPVSRLALQELIKSFGYETVVCVDGTGAWQELSRDEAPELAILDWVMPGYDGIDICRMLRESDTPAATYVMLLTVKGQRREIVEGLHAGADDYLTKPFEKEELRARLDVGRRLVELQQQRVEHETAYYVEQLEATVAELRESRARVVEAQEEVRRAISEELHGQVQSHMAVFYLRLKEISERLVDSPTEAAEELSKVAEDLDSLRENEIRQLSHRLHPSIIRVSLSSGMRHLRDQYERVLPVNLEIDDAVQDMEQAGRSTIPLSIRLGLYRVAEEALGNVIRHADADTVTVRLRASQDGRVLRLSVEDDGTGFEMAAIGGGHSLGLANIRDYMGAIDGTFEVDSEPGRGTTVRASVSLVRPGDVDA